jgi:hypothetical protein
VLKSVNGYEPTNIQELVAVLAREMHSEMVEFRCQVEGQDDADYFVALVCLGLFFPEADNVLTRFSSPTSSVPGSLSSFIGALLTPLIFFEAGCDMVCKSTTRVMC